MVGVKGGLIVNDIFYFAAILVFFIGWLISQVKPWGNFVAIAGASLFVLVFVLHALKLI
jgi:hypothetical protein